MNRSRQMQIDEFSQLSINQTIGFPYTIENAGAPPGCEDFQPEYQEVVELIGAYAFLAQYSRPHDHYPSIYLANRVLPAFNKGSFRFHFHDDVPLAFVNWTWVSDRVDANLSQGLSTLTMDDWHVGSNFWFMEILAPFGHSIDLMIDLHNNVFKSVPNAKALYVDDQGQLVQSRQFKNFVEL